jgi:hypothetical protein
MASWDHAPVEHSLRILDASGDTVVTWDPESPESVKAAETEFLRIQALGLPLFAIEAPGKMPEQVRHFDPEAFEIVATPRYIGG